MKILHIISSPSAGGAEVYIKDLSIEMAKKGNEVFILFLNMAKDIGRDQNYENNFLNELAMNNISYDFIGYKARKNIFFGIKRIRDLTTQINPDIIHCHLYYAAFYACFTKNKKIIYTHHNIKLGVNKLFYKLLDLRIHTYIGICYACHKLLSNIVKKQVIQIDNGVNINRLSPKIRNNHQPNNIIKILVVGRLSKQKNLDLLINSLIHINTKNILIELAGEGPERTHLENLVKQHSLTNQVKFLGNQTNIPFLLKNADIFAMSSSWEGLPIALIEATLSGLPCIVTNVGGCAEIIHQALNGIVIENTQDPKLYAEGLTKLINSEELRKQFSDNAITYSKKYDINTSVTQHLDLYKNILADKKFHQH